jgi:hypothetical protein
MEAEGEGASRSITVASAAAPLKSGAFQEPRMTAQYFYILGNREFPLPNWPDTRAIRCEIRCERDQLFIEAGAAAGRLGCVPPYLLHLAELNIRSRRVTIQEILEERIAAFDFDVIYFFREGGVTDQGEYQIIEVFESVVGGHPDEVVSVECPEDSGNGRLHKRFRASRP